VAWFGDLDYLPSVCHGVVFMYMNHLLFTG